MARRASDAMVRHAPFAVVLFYIVLSTVVFWFGPMPWPVVNIIDLALFQAAALLFLAGGYLSETRRPVRNTCRINLRPFFYFGIISVIALQVPVTLTYTGKYPWDVFSVLMDQRQIYEEMLEEIANTQGSRFFVPLLRAILSPLLLISVGYGLLNFRTLSWFQKALLVVALLCPIDLSLLRGTDKEIADVAIILCGLLLVAYCRRAVSARQNQPLISFSVWRLVTIAAVVFFLFFMFFSYRKLQRLGGNFDFCVDDGLICADYSGAIVSTLPDFVAFGYAMISMYLTNGYYGLGLALDLPFETVFGFGHSPALLSLYERISGNTDLFDSTFIARVSELGWDHRYYWSSLYTWLANDVGFPGALIVTALLARWFRQAWVEAVYADNDLAAIVFVLLCIAFLYLPANNQIAQTFDMYFAFIGTFVAWKFNRFKIRRNDVFENREPVSGVGVRSSGTK
jgi:hypothetical protein